MRFLRQLCAIGEICAFLILSATLTSCGDEDGSGYTFGYDIPANPANLDPQSAGDTESLLIIENVFEGLLRLQEDGSLTEGMATDYTVSADELTYIFTLRKDAKWTDANGFEAPVTAQDFVFAFRRLFDPTTAAPNAAKLYCIKNAEAVHHGAVLPETLGVRAEGDYTLVIELAYASATLPSLLATAPCMPCNEAYFYATKGKYGLDAAHTPSNGAFYVKSWNYDPYSSNNNQLTLRRSAAYSERIPVYPAGLTFYITPDKSTYMDRFLAGDTDLVVASGNQAAQLMGDGYNMVGHEAITWGLVFNLKDELLSSANLRLALAAAVDRTQYQGYLPQGMDIARAIVPPDVTMLEQSYRALAGEEQAPAYSPQEANAFLSQAKAELGTLTIDPITVIMPKTVANADTFSFVAQTWQKDLGFFCVLQELEEEEYKRRVEAGDYSAAIVSLTGSYNSPDAFLSAFKNGIDTYRSGFSDGEYDRLLTAAQTEGSYEDSAALYLQAEQRLLSSGVFVPLYYQTEYLAIGHGMYDAAYNPFTKAIRFVNIKRLE